MPSKGFNPYITVTEDMSYPVLLNLLRRPKPLSYHSRRFAAPSSLHA